MPRLLLLYGPEPLLVDELLDRLTAAALPDPTAAACNREVLHADGLRPENLVAAGSALPLFGAQRLVLVRGLGNAPARIVDRLRAAIDTARAQPSGWPAEGTTVVLVAAGADRRAPAVRLAEDAERVEVRPPVGRAVLGWLHDRARAAGFRLAPAAAQTLVELVGEDLGRLASEVEKAAAYAGQDGHVSDEAVRALVGETRVRQLWELTRALEERRRPDAVRLLEQLLIAGEDPLAVLTWVTGYVRGLWRVLGGLADSLDARQIARLLRPPRPEFAVEHLMSRARALGPESVRKAIDRCFEVECLIKTSGGSPRALLTHLVADLAA